MIENWFHFTHSSLKLECITKWCTDATPYFGPEGSGKITLAGFFGPFKVITRKKLLEDTQKNVARKNLFRKNSIQIFKCAVKTRQQSLLCALDKRIAFQSFLKCSNVRFSFWEKFSEFSDVTLDGTVICPNDKSNQVNRVFKMQLQSIEDLSIFAFQLKNNFWVVDKTQLMLPSKLQAGIFF